MKIEHITLPLGETLDVGPACRVGRLGLTPDGLAHLLIQHSDVNCDCPKDETK